MKKTTAAVFCVCLLSLSLWAKQGPKRIVFPKGAAKVIVTGNFSNPKATLSYVIRLRAGRTLSVVQEEEPFNQHLVSIGGIMTPSGQDITDWGMGCNNSFETSPTVAGDYTFLVAECNKEKPWRGTFRLIITAE